MQCSSHATLYRSERLQSWLEPPVQAHLTAYGFHLTNPEAVARGRKPIVEEVGTT